MKSKTNDMLRLKLATAVLLACQAMAGHAQIAVPTPPVPTLDITRFVIDGDALLSADEQQKVLAPFTGPKRSLTDIEQAAQALEKAIRDKGYAFHRAFVPVQKPVNGEIKLQIISFKVGKVEVTGNQNFTTDNIRRGLQGLREGEAPRVDLLGRDVSASNANPAKQIAVTFKESTEPTSVDALVRVQDTPPLAFYATLTGNHYVSGPGAEANVWRISGIAQHSNLFDRDHVMTLSYTTDVRQPRDVSLFGAYYQVPLYGLGATVSAYLTTSNINSGTVQQGAGVFNVSGSGRFGGLRYTQALPRLAQLQHTVAASFEDRLFRNSTTFNGVQITPDVSSRTVGLHYAMRSDVSWGEVLGGVDYVTNVGGGDNNNDVAFAANGGVRRWDVFRYNLTASAKLSNWNLTGKLRGQASGKNLISGEQLGLGGVGTVRGFNDRVVAGDEGLQWSVESTGPELFGTPLKPAVFVDGGRVKMRATGVSESLTSVGAGVRFAREKVLMSLDVAQAVDGPSFTTGHPWRLHFNASYRF